MPKSLEYRLLERRHAALRKRFMPKAFSSSGSYSDTVLDKARAFRVLIHAELEHYLEQKALSVASNAFSAWNRTKKVSLPLINLVTNISGNTEGLPKKLNTSWNSGKVVAKSFAQYKHFVEHNHGIRVENVMGLLLPVGIEEQDLDPAWLSTIDGFGTKRGRAAHTAAVTYQIDPKDDDNVVKTIVSGMQSVDEMLTDLAK